MIGNPAYPKMLHCDTLITAGILMEKTWKSMPKSWSFTVHQAFFFTNFLPLLHPHPASLTLCFAGHQLSLLVESHPLSWSITHTITHKAGLMWTASHKNRSFGTVKNLWLGRGGLEVLDGWSKTNSTCYYSIFIEFCSKGSCGIMNLKWKICNTLSNH